MSSPSVTTRADATRVLFVVGAGIDPARHLTLEAMATLSRCSIVFCITGDVDGLTTALRRHDVRGPIVDLMPLYHDGGLDRDNYSRIISRLRDAVVSHGSVAVVVNGHPQVGVSWWSDLRDDPMFDGEIVFVEGISSALSIPAALNRDPIEKGCTIMDVNRFLLFDYEVSPELDLVILDVCSTGTRRTHLSDPSKDSEWPYLCKRLRRYFPATHPAFLVLLSMADGHATTISERTIGDLDQAIEEVTYGTSLFVPGLRPSRVDMIALRALLKDDRR